MFWYALFSFFISPAAVNTVSTLNPDEFAINTNTHTVQKVWNASYPNDVQRVDDQTIALPAQSTIVLSSKGCTQYQWESTVSFQTRHALRIVVRTTRTDVERGGHSGLAFLIDESGLSVHENGKSVAHIDSIRFDTQRANQSVYLSCFAGETTLRIGCDLVFTTRTLLDATEGIEIQTLENAPARLSHIVRSDAFEQLLDL